MMRAGKDGRVAAMLTGVCLAGLLIAWPMEAPAMMMYEREQVPIDRLIERLQERVDREPADAHARYTLGRAHYLAAVHRQHILTTTQRRYTSPQVPGQVLDHLPRPPIEEAEPLDAEAVRGHVREAVRHHRAALARADEPLYHLGLASVLQELAPHADDLELDEPVAVPDDLKPLVPKAGANADAEDAAEPRAREAVRWRLAALDHYAQAFEKQVDADRELERLSMIDLGMISLEAARQYERLSEKLGAQEIRAEQLERITEAARELRERPAVITPIIFALEAVEDVNALLDESATATFDLDGTGREQRWQWVSPHTGILVWDPRGTGEVRSGRQLFGSVTWWMFWRHGYEPLAILDEDRSGWLRGAELDDLAVWFDRNQDGIAQPGEVTPVRELGIKAIAVEPTGRDAGMPTAERGIKLDDGRVLPTWDWIAEPATEPTPAR